MPDIMSITHQAHSIRERFSGTRGSVSPRLIASRHYLEHFDFLVIAYWEKLYFMIEHLRKAQPEARYYTASSNSCTAISGNCGKGLPLVTDS